MFSRNFDKRSEKVVLSNPLKIIALIIAVTFMSVFGKMMLYPVNEGNLEVHFIDVGQGDAELLLTENASILIDTGTKASQDSLIRYLQSHVEKLDYLIISHPHEDHMGGTEKVLDSIDVRCVIMPDTVNDTSFFVRTLDLIESKGISTKIAEPGDIISLGDLRIEILAPLSDEYDRLNNYSIVCRVDFGENSFLFTGDAEKTSEKELLSEYGANHLDCDVLKVGHHGSLSSSTESFISAVSPKYCVIEVGKDNDYGHPDSKVVDRLKASGARVFRTDKSGTVIIKSDGINLSVSD